MARIPAFSIFSVQFNLRLTLISRKAAIIFLLATTLLVSQAKGDLVLESGPVSDSVSKLISKLQSSNRDIRLYAVNALARLGPRAILAVPALITVLKDQDKSVRISAVFALGRVGPEAKEAVPALIATLDDQDAAVRSYAAIALGQIGAEFTKPAPALIKALITALTGISSSSAKIYGKNPASTPPTVNFRAKTAKTATRQSFCVKSLRTISIARKNRQRNTCIVRNKLGC